MSKRFTSAIAALALTAGLSVPAVGFAHGNPQANGKAKPCPTHSHTGKHKGKANGAGKGKGKKCGIASSGSSTS
jgi:hypothetical protein